MKVALWIGLCLWVNGAWGAGTNPTATPTLTLTPTLTATLTPSASPTFTPTLTTTGTQPATWTPTPTSTLTFTRTITLSPTITRSPTKTYTPTITRSPTQTGTPTSTITRTPTITPTPTVTPGVAMFKISPKPDSEKKISFKWKVNIPAEKVYLKVYSSGFRLVRSFEFNKVDSPDFLAKGTHEFKWDCKDEQNRPMPPGIYLCFIDVAVKKKVYESSSKTEIP